MLKDGVGGEGCETTGRVSVWWWEGERVVEGAVRLQAKPGSVSK